MPALRQPKSLKELSANTIMKFIPTYSSIQYVNYQLPRALLDYLKVKWLEKNLYCSKETLEKIDGNELFHKILNRVQYKKINLGYTMNKVEKLLKRCKDDICFLRREELSSDVNTSGEEILQTIFDNTVNYHYALVTVYVYICTEERILMV